MGNTLNVVECCGPCSLDGKKPARSSGAKTIEVRKKEVLDGGALKSPQKKEDRQVVLDDEPTQDLSQISQATNSDAGGNPPSSTKFTFRNMTRQDYFNLYDAIHKLLRSEEISKDQENILYDMIGRQDKGLAAAYKKYKDEHDPIVLVEPLKARTNSKIKATKGAQV